MKWISAFYLMFLMPLGTVVTAQAPSPVSWSTEVEKTSGNGWNLKLTATMQPGWYIYSQYMDEGGPVPTVVTFSGHPQVALQDSVREVGVLKSAYEDVFMMETHYYREQVTFVQSMQVKGRLPVTVKGTVSYMVCDS